MAKVQEHQLQETQRYITFGEWYASTNKNVTAIQNDQKGSETAKEQGNKQKETQEHLDLGEWYRSNNNNKSAIPHYQKGVQIAKEKGYLLQEAKAYLGLGYACIHDSQNPAAIEHFKISLQIAREQGYKEQETSAHLGLGYWHITNNNNETAIQHYQTALEIARDQGHKLQETKAHLGLGDWYRFNNKSKTAIQHYKKGLEIAKEQRYNLQETQAYLGLGYACIHVNQNQTALEQFEKSLQISREGGYKQQQTNAHLGLGDWHTSNNKNETAIQHHQTALEIARDQGYKLQELQAYLQLGYCYRSNNKNETAIQHYEKGLEIAREQGYKQQETQAYLGLGYVYIYENQNQAAIKHFEKSLEIAAEQGYEQQETHAYIGIGDLYKSNNENKTAIECYKKSLEIAKELGYKLQETQAYQRLGYASICDNQNQTAIKYFEKSLEIAKEHGYKLQETITHLELRDLYRFNNNSETATKHYQKALEIAREQGYKNLKPNAMKELSRYADRNNVEIIHEDLNNSNSTDQIASTSRAPASWKWVERSIIHRERLIKLREEAKNLPKKIQEINGVRVCCSKEFLIGKGSDGTRVYVGLGKDGVEKAVKRLPRDACTDLAEQEKKVLNGLNTKKSQNVVNYWFLEEQSDKDYLFLILDLCEETLENFVKRSSDTDLVKYAPDIINQVLKGLVDLHQGPNPILHRDLKPSNILRNIQDNWLLADFGISRILMEDMATHESMSRGTEDWKAVESCSFKERIGDGKSNNVRYKEESDIQVAGMVAFYILTKGEHPFGEKPDRLRNLLDGKPVGLDKLKDDAAKDLISWMLNHDPKDRPSAKEALKHPYVQPVKQQFEMLCKIGNQPEIKTQDVKSDVVRKLNSNPDDWRSKIAPDVLTYLSTDCLKRKLVFYGPSWTECLRLIRNVNQHWHDRPSPRPEAFYNAEDPQKYFLNLFPSICVEVHKILRSCDCDWKERDDLKEYFV